MTRTAASASSRHWPEYFMEAALLGLFMISACAFTVLLEFPGSAVRQAVPDPGVRRFLTGLAMGSTAIALIYSPWGKQSGAHFNPSTTLTFWWLGKVRSQDATWYIVAQFVGSAVGVMIAHALLGPRLADPTTHFAATVPGAAGSAVAFVAEAGISFVLMSIILRVSNHDSLARYTGVFAGGLVALYITFEAPLSGMSMNPARTFGSAVAAGDWTALWLYFTAPPLGMIAAAAIYLRRRGAHSIACAKLHHQNDKRCIHCGARMEPFSSPPHSSPRQREHAAPAPHHLTREIEG
jgi:aquaporin Z